MNKLFFVWELWKNNLIDNGDGTFQVFFKNKAISYYIGKEQDLKKHFPDTEKTYFEIASPDVFVVLMKVNTFENKEGAFCREAYDKAVKEGADVSDFIEYTTFLKSKEERWECTTCKSFFSKNKIGIYSNFCPNCGFPLREENDAGNYVRNSRIENKWGQMVTKFIDKESMRPSYLSKNRNLKRKPRIESEKEKEDVSDEFKEKLFKLFLAQFEVYWKSRNNFNRDLARKYDRERADIHNQIKFLINGDMMVVQRAIGHIEKQKGKELYQLIDIEDRKEAMAVLNDFAYACVEYIIEEEL